MAKNVKSLRAMACGLGLAASVLGLAGCASSHEEHHHAAANSKADMQLATDVATSLSHAPGTRFPDVAVDAHQGQVRLRGFVASDAEKAEAEGIAAQVPGVAQVKNDLTVRPGSVPAGGATAPGGTTQQPSQ